MNRLRVAVVGCGHLGRIHARLLSQNESVHLVGVADPSVDARSNVALEAQAEAFADYRQLIGNVDAAIVAAPTGLHVELAQVLLDAGIDLLVEKPLAAGARDAMALANFAIDRSRVLAVGHVERFNPAFVAAEQTVDCPTYIEATRAGGFTFRSMDVGVVLDLMIHDIELVLSLVDSPVVRVAAQGLSVMTDREDFAEARIEFGNGTVARLKASRVSPSIERRMAMYGPEAHTFVDFGDRTTQCLKPSPDVHRGHQRADHFSADQIAMYRDRVFQDLLPVTKLNVADTNPLADEQQDFIDSVLKGRDPRVSGTAAATAVWVAERVLDEIHAAGQTGQTQPLRRAA